MPEFAGSGGVAQGPDPARTPLTRPAAASVRLESPTAERGEGRRLALDLVGAGPLAAMCEEWSLRRPGQLRLSLVSLLRPRQPRFVRPNITSPAMPLPRSSNVPGSGV